MRFLRGLPLVALALVITLVGCLESDQDITLNPDLTGKLQVEVLMPLSPPIHIGAQKDAPSPEAMAQQIAGKVFAESKGIDAWSDLKYEVVGEKVKVTGTGYFRDLAAVNLGPAGKTNLKLTKDDTGQIILRLEPKNTSKAPASGETVPKVSDEDALARARKQKAQYEQSRPMLAMLQGLKITMHFAMPGDITAAEHFTTEGRTASIVLDGAKIMAAMDELQAKPEEWWVEQIKLTGSDEASTEEVCRALFGSPSVPQVTVDPAGAGPQFDYDAEVKAAKEAEPKIRAALGLPAQ